MAEMLGGSDGDVGAWSEAEMVKFFKGGVRDLSPEQLELLAVALRRSRFGRASKKAAQLGYGDNLDEADLERQLERIGCERCPHCGAWVGTQDIISEEDGFFLCRECAEGSDDE